MSDSKTLSKDFIIYAIGNLAQRAVMVVLLPLYTKSLDLKTYGLLETINITIQILIFIMDLGMSRSVLRYYARYQNEPKKLGELITTALTMMGLACGLVLLLGVFMQQQISSALFDESQFGILIVWTFLSASLQTVNFWIFILFRARRQSIRYVIVSVINLIALSALNIIFVQYYNLGLMGVFYAQIIVYTAINLIFLPGILYPIRHNLSFTKDMVIQLFTFGAPLIFIMAGALTINYVDRYFLVHYRTLEDVGIYSFGVRVASIQNLMIVTPFQLAWAPFLFAKEAEDMRSFASRVLTFLVLALAASATFILFFNKEFIAILSGAEYAASSEIIPYMLISMSLLGVYYWAGGLVNLIEQTWKLGLLGAVTGIVNILLNFLLTPRFGWAGASWANILARGMATFVTLWIAYRQTGVQYERKRLLQVLFVTAGLWFFYYQTIDLLDGWGGMLIKTAVQLIGLFILLFPLHFLSEQEWSQVRNLAGVFLRRLGFKPSKPKVIT